MTAIEFKDNLEELITEAYGDLTLVQIYEALKKKLAELKMEIADHNDTPFDE